MQNIDLLEKRKAQPYKSFLFLLLPHIQRHARAAAAPRVHVDPTTYTHTREPRFFFLLTLVPPPLGRRCYDRPNAPVHTHTHAREHARVQQLPLSLALPLSTLGPSMRTQNVGLVLYVCIFLPVACTSDVCVRVRRFCGGCDRKPSAWSTLVIVRKEKKKKGAFLQAFAPTDICEKKTNTSTLSVKSSANWRWKRARLGWLGEYVEATNICLARSQSPKFGAVKEEFSHTLLRKSARPLKLRGIRTSQLCRRRVGRANFCCLPTFFPPTSCIHFTLLSACVICLKWNHAVKYSTPMILKTCAGLVLI